MRLLIDDTYATGTYTVPISSSWVSPPDGMAVEIVPGLTSANLAAGDIALAPAGELLSLQETHAVAPAVAVVAEMAGAVALRTPVRPDEVEATPVRLFDTSSTAEILARATLLPFYGITATEWVRDGDATAAATAQAVIVEGVEALREPEGGFSEDLAKAWFILTAGPVVSHLLLAPREMALPRLQEAMSFLDAARAEGLARRREWRPAQAEREGIARDRANAFWAAQRLELQDGERQSLRDLLTRGRHGTALAPKLHIAFIDGAGAV